MREILFRAKAINRNKGYHRTKYKNGDWVYGLLTKLYDEQFENLPAEMTNEYGVSGIEIDHKTIGQFTGLLDKNSNKIFEGDIVKDIAGRMKAVEFYNGRYYPFISFPEYTCWNTDEVEVIGNIHDYPELLRSPQNNEVRE